MELILRGKEAFGRPGIPPRWTRSEKEGVGTAYHTASRIWFTLAHGILNEVYFPRVDSPQTRDMGFLVTDGKSFLHEEKRDLTTRLEYLDSHSLGYRMINSDPEGRYHIIKEVIADPHLPCVLTHIRLEGDATFLKGIRLFVLLAPHLEVGGWGNTAAKEIAAGREILVAYRNRIHLALGATVPFLKSSCGFVGASDGWTDLQENFEMDWEFDYAKDGNVAVTAEIDLSEGPEFTLGLAMGFGLHAATSTLLQSISVPYREHRTRFQGQWQRACSHVFPLQHLSGDNGRLYHTSHSLLLAHEDKTYPGAIIASMSIPWGEIHGDQSGLGGYHLVWTRDLCNSASGLLAAGGSETPLRALIYLASSQNADGGFYQSFWVDGTPYWNGIQLDEVAFPVLLAGQLGRHNGLKEFDPYPMVLKAAAYLMERGPITPQERWEENSGYSPSTLASNIAALISAAEFARQRKEIETATFLEEYADFLESHIEAWTVTTQGTLLTDVLRHYVRIQPVDPDDPVPRDDPNNGVILITNQPPGTPFTFPAKEIVDAGFLELVRYGIRPAGDPLIEDSLRVVDAYLKVETRFGPVWRRYNHDGYGQRADGGPYAGWGVGRAWPLLTGERGHYELATGRDVGRYIRAIEGFASSGGMLPEQVWDAPDQPEGFMYLGRPTGSVMPLLWAHAEYIKLLRSAHDGKIFDLIPAVAERYLKKKGRNDLEIWKFNRQIQSVLPGVTLRIQISAPFRLHATLDGWKTVHEKEARSTAIGIFFADIGVPGEQRAPIQFTFYWPKGGRWEGRDFAVAVRSDPS